MKKIASLITLILILVSHPFTSQGTEASPLNDKTTPTQVIQMSLNINGVMQSGKASTSVVNNVYMVSALPSFKSMGAYIKWDESKKRIDIKYKAKKVILYANKNVAYINNLRKSVDTAPRVINGIPMVSFGLIEQATGMQVVLDKEDRIIYIHKPSGSSSYQPANMPKLLTKASKKVVVIDPGHGGKEKGAMYGGLYEKNLNLDVSLKLYSLLKKNGVRVYMTRSSDKTVSLKDRSSLANRLNASLLISVHHNALPNNKYYSGTETLYHPWSSSRGNINGRQLAQITQKELVSRLGTANRGTISRPNLSVLRRSSMPSVIAEIGYMSNVNERNRLKNSEFQQKAAEALCSAVIKSLNQM